MPDRNVLGGPLEPCGTDPLVTALNWLRAHREGCAAPVVQAATHERTLDVVPLEALAEHDVDVPHDPGNL